MRNKTRLCLDLPLPPVDGATAAWLVDLCGRLQHALWQAYGDEIEAHWTATEPEQPIYGDISSLQRPRR